MRQIIFLTFLGLSCCTAEKNEARAMESQKTASVDNEFIRFLDLLPKLILPFEANCEDCCDHPEIEYDNGLIRKFMPEGSRIIGLVSQTEERAIILVTYPADMIIPSLNVYDLKGNLTGDMTFMTDYCGGEPGFYNRQFFKIDRNLSVSEIDTLYETTFDSITYRTLDTVGVKITKKNFRIDEKRELVADNAP